MEQANRLARAGLELIPGEFSLYVNDMAASAKSNRKPHAKLPAKQPAGPEIDAWVQLANAYHRIARRLELALIPHGLSLAQFEVLARLHFDGPINQNDLAQRLLVTKGNVCGLIDRLEKASLVKRRTDPADRRANRLILTKDGSALLAAALPIISRSSNACSAASTMSSYAPCTIRRNGSPTRRKSRCVIGMNCGPTIGSCKIGVERTMNQSLTDLLRMKQTLSVGGIDWDDRRDKYVSAVNDLYNQIEKMLAEPIAAEYGQGRATQERAHRELYRDVFR